MDCCFSETQWTNRPRKGELRLAADLRRSDRRSAVPEGAVPEAVPRDTGTKRRSPAPHRARSLCTLRDNPSDGRRRRRPNVPKTPPSARVAHATPPLRLAPRPRRAHLIFPAAAAGARGRRGAGSPPGAAPLAAPGPAALPGQRGGGQPLRRPGHVAGSRPAALRVSERVWAGQSSRRRLPPRSHARRGRPAPRSLRRRPGPAGGWREMGAPEPAPAAAGDPRAALTARYLCGCKERQKSYFQLLPQEAVLSEPTPCPLAPHALPAGCQTPLSRTHLPTHPAPPASAAAVRGSSVPAGAQRGAPPTLAASLCPFSYTID